jgi:hypothetical protein
MDFATCGRYDHPLAVALDFTASAQYNSAIATTASTTADPDPRIPAPFALGSSGRARLPATIRPSG